MGNRGIGNGKPIGNRQSELTIGKWTSGNSHRQLAMGQLLDGQSANGGNCSIANRQWGNCSIANRQWAIARSLIGNGQFARSLIGNGQLLDGQSAMEQSDRRLPIADCRSATITDSPIHHRAITDCPLPMRIADCGYPISQSRFADCRWVCHYPLPIPRLPD
jgi:hypothetical protein